ncbi:hypothetical protein [Mycolicibacterium litorale]|uniref:PE-PGRS family protein n=1 Tax=Mycolicibacterium litorale TaxID=758802 RepID=A0AAD1MT46_9MYCO|nr:hypothetical protein [Mycolicibacterium litorale]MCV7418762.1 hypothetical protein [Mycolicibacterium litorale]TDY05838.1 hypothetical protein BCL50_2146 [Mycolicibacterium litorale]BBY14656.1 hypothetical protein MLIT_02480 [Mycolicibacterium litorale]
MHAAARSYLSTGVALVGAGAIAMSPVAPPVPDLEVPAVSSIGVGLSAAVNPLQTWIEVFGQAAENISILGQEFIARPAPILQQIIENQWSNVETLAPALEAFAQGFLASLSPTNPNGIPANLREAFELIITGHPAEGVPAIFQAFLQPILFPSLELLVPIQGIITQSAQNVLDVANLAITTVALGAIGLLNPVFSGFNAFGAAAQAVVDAANEGDLLGAFTAVLDIPGVVAGGVLNGYGFDGGFLTPMSGTIAAIMTLRNMIADALKPNPPEAPLRTTEISSTSTDPAASVTIDVTDSAVTSAARQTSTTENLAPETGGGAGVVDEPTDDETTDDGTADGTADEKAGEDELADETAAEDEVADDEAAEEEAAEEEAAEEEAAEEEPAAQEPAAEDNAGAENTGADDTGGAEA